MNLFYEETMKKKNEGSKYSFQDVVCNINYTLLLIFTSKDLLTQTPIMKAF